MGMKIVGITRGTSKKNLPFTVLHVIGEFDDYQAQRSSGKKAENIYIGKNINVNLEDEVNLVYGVGFGGKAIVKDVIVLSSK